MPEVTETFKSLQGESTHAGRVCFFIRLTGCNLDCCYCDTLYAKSGGEYRSIGDLVDEAEKSGCKLVEITGGEPLVQSETPELIERLINSGFEVLLETNGSCDIGKVHPQCRKIVDRKLPDSGMDNFHLTENWNKLSAHDEVKFVVSSKNDFDFAVEEIKKYKLYDKTPHLIFSPVWGKVKFDDLAQWVVECGLPVRMQLQMHKLIWGDRKGV